MGSSLFPRWASHRHSDNEHSVKAAQAIVPLCFLTFSWVPHPFTRQATRRRKFEERSAKAAQAGDQFSSVYDSLGGGSGWVSMGELPQGADLEEVLGESGLLLKKSGRWSP